MCNAKRGYGEKGVRSDFEPAIVSARDAPQPPLNATLRRSLKWVVNSQTYLLPPRRISSSMFVLENKTRDYLFCYAFSSLYLKSNPWKTNQQTSFVYLGEANLAAKYFVEWERVKLPWTLATEAAFENMCCFGKDRCGGFQKGQPNSRILIKNELQSAGTSKFMHIANGDWLGLYHRAVHSIEICSNYECRYRKLGRDFYIILSRFSMTKYQINFWKNA